LGWLQMRNFKTDASGHDEVNSQAADEDVALTM
jgi:hypothetical protein